MCTADVLLPRQERGTLRKLFTKPLLQVTALPGRLASRCRPTVWTSVSEGSYLFSVARGAEKAKAERGKKRDGFCFWRFYWLLQRALLLSFLLLAKPDSGAPQGDAWKSNT